MLITLSRYSLLSSFSCGENGWFRGGRGSSKRRSRGSTDPERPFTGGGRFHPIPGVNANLSADSAPRNGDESESERSPALLRVGHHALALEDLPVDPDRTTSLAVGIYCTRNESLPLRVLTSIVVDSYIYTSRLRGRTVIATTAFVRVRRLYRDEYFVVAAQHFLSAV